MPRIPDRFDLWVRKARASIDTDRQMDWVLGALLAREELFFLNSGTKEQPRIAQIEMSEERCALVFTDGDRIEEFMDAHRDAVGSAIASPSASALAWCVESRLGLVINPSVGETAWIVAEAVALFLGEWKQRGGRQATGFWIPSMTTEEEDFWQENGL
jgi:hypothetical protein